MQRWSVHIPIMDLSTFVWDCHFCYEVFVSSTQYSAMYSVYTVCQLAHNTVQCTVWFYLPNSITAVSASFWWPSSDLSRWYSYFGEPPNIVVCIRPGHTLQAVRVCPHRVCVPSLSGRVSWGEGNDTWITVVQWTYYVWSWIVSSRTWHKKVMVIAD